MRVTIEPTAVGNQKLIMNFSVGIPMYASENRGTFASVSFVLIIRCLAVVAINCAYPE